MSKFSDTLNKNIKTITSGTVALLFPLFGSTLSFYIIYTYPSVPVYFGEHLFLFAFCTSLTMGLLLTPTTFIASLGGYLYGIEVLPIIVLSYTISSLIGFYLGKKVDGGSLMEQLRKSEKGKQFEKALELNPYWFVIFCRISPVLPFGLMNIALPSFNINLRQFLLAGTAGMFPRTLLFVWLGSTAKSIQEAIERGNGVSLKLYMTLGLALVSTIGLLILMKKMFK